MLDSYGRILVTGGAGFIGSHLVDTLLALGKEEVVFDCLSTGREENVSPQATLITGDLRYPEQVSKAMERVELVFHVGANANGTVSVNDPRLDFETNGLGTFNVLEAAVQTGVRRLVYQSSAAVYGTPQTHPMREDHPKQPFMPYGASKFTGEVLCGSFLRTYDLQVGIARPFAVYGPRESPSRALVEITRYLGWHLNGMPIQIVGDPDRKTRDFVHVSDVIEGLLIIAEKAHAGEAYNLGSGEEVTMRQLAAIIGSATGRPAEIDAITSITQDTYRHVADISKLRSLGYEPRMSIPEGVRRQAEDLGERPEMPEGATIFKKGQLAEV